MNILLAIVLAAPVPVHLMLPVGTEIAWPGNPTVWRVVRTENNKVFIQCADGSGEVYARDSEELRSLRYMP